MSGSILMCCGFEQVTLTYKLDGEAILIRTCNMYMWRNEPAHEIMVLITKAASEGSGEPAHSRSLARAFAVRTHAVWKYTKGLTKNQTSISFGWQCLRV